MMKLKSYCAAFEIPFYEVSEEDAVNLSRDIAEKYLDSIDVLVNEIVPKELPNLNQVWVYVFVARVDDNFTNPDTFNSEWDNMISGILGDIKYFFRNTTIYQVLFDERDSNCVNEIVYDK